MVHRQARVQQRQSGSSHRLTQCFVGEHQRFDIGLIHSLAHRVRNQTGVETHAQPLVDTVPGLRQTPLVQTAIGTLCRTYRQRCQRGDVDVVRAPAYRRAQKIKVQSVARLPDRCRLLQ